MSSLAAEAGDRRSLALRSRCVQDDRSPSASRRSFAGQGNNLPLLKPRLASQYKALQYVRIRESGLDEELTWFLLAIAILIAIWLIVGVVGSVTGIVDDD